MSDVDAQEVLARSLAEKPWLTPEQASIWSITGEYNRPNLNARHSFRDCIAMVYDFGDGPLFMLTGPVSGIGRDRFMHVVFPEEITHATEYLLVERYPNGGAA